MQPQARGSNGSHVNDQAWVDLQVIVVVSVWNTDHARVTIGNQDATRADVRLERSAPILARIDAWLSHYRARASGKVTLGRGTALYRQIPRRSRPLPDRWTCRAGRQHLRAHHPPIALNRKNALFAGHDAGAENRAVIASLIKTRKMNAVDPHAWQTRNTHGHRQRPQTQPDPRSAPPELRGHHVIGTPLTVTHGEDYRSISDGRGSPPDWIPSLRAARWWEQAGWKIRPRSLPGRLERRFRPDSEAASAFLRQALSAAGTVTITHVTSPPTGQAEVKPRASGLR